MKKLYIIYGPPGAGKTTYVKERIAETTDDAAVIDLDYLKHALYYKGYHDQLDDTELSNLWELRNYILYNNHFNVVYLITTELFEDVEMDNLKEVYSDIETINIIPEKDKVIEQMENSDRQDKTMWGNLIDDWYKAHERHTKPSTHIRAKSNDSGKKYIEGYFIVFNKMTNLGEGYYEIVEPGAINSDQLNNVVALYEHKSEYVLGRVSNGTLRLNIDNIGIYGIIEINEKDADAVNLYHRVARGDIKGCSFGFSINDQVIEYREDGTTLFRLTDINLYEVTVTTFPAYNDTSIKARNNLKQIAKQHKLELRKQKLKGVLNFEPKANIN